MLVNVFQHNLTRLGEVKTHIKPNPNPPWGKPRFLAKAKMAAIKPVIYVFVLINRYHLRPKHRRATYNMSFRTNFLRAFICSQLKFIRGETEDIFKVKVKLDLKKLNNFHF